MKIDVSEFRRNLAIVEGRAGPGVREFSLRENGITPIIPEPILLPAVGSFSQVELELPECLESFSDKEIDEMIAAAEKKGVTAEEFFKIAEELGEDGIKQVLGEEYLQEFEPVTTLAAGYVAYKGAKALHKFIKNRTGAAGLKRKVKMQQLKAAMTHAKADTYRAKASKNAAKADYHASKAKPASSAPSAPAHTPAAPEKKPEAPAASHTQSSSSGPKGWKPKAGQAARREALKQTIHKAVSSVKQASARPAPSRSQQSVRNVRVGARQASAARTLRSVRRGAKVLASAKKARSGFKAVLAQAKKARSGS